MAPIADVTAAIDKALPAEPSAARPKSARNGAKRATGEAAEAANGRSSRKKVL